MSSFEQKNNNILNRFETKQLGSKSKCFSVVTKDHRMTVLDMENSSLDDIKKSAFDKFGSDLVSVIEA